MNIEIVNYGTGDADRIDVVVYVAGIGDVVFQLSQGSIETGETGLWLADDDEVTGAGRQAAFAELDEEKKSEILDAAQAAFDEYLEQCNGAN